MVTDSLINEIRWTHPYDTVVRTQQPGTGRRRRPAPLRPAAAAQEGGIITVMPALRTSPILDHVLLVKWVSALENYFIILNSADEMLRNEERGSPCARSSMSFQASFYCTLQRIEQLWTNRFTFHNNVKCVVLVGNYRAINTRSWYNISYIYHFITYPIAISIDVKTLNLWCVLKIQ